MGPEKPEMAVKTSESGGGRGLGGSPMGFGEEKKGKMGSGKEKWRNGGMENGDIERSKGAKGVRVEGRRFEKAPKKIRLIQLKASASASARVGDTYVGTRPLKCWSTQTYKNQINIKTLPFFLKCTFHGVDHSFWSEIYFNYC